MLFFRIQAFSGIGNPKNFRFRCFFEIHGCFRASETVKTSVSDAFFGKSGLFLAFRRFQLSSIEIFKSFRFRCFFWQVRAFSGIPPLSGIGNPRNFRFRCFSSEFRLFLASESVKTSISDAFLKFMAAFEHRNLQKLPFPMLLLASQGFFWHFATFRHRKSRKLQTPMLASTLRKQLFIPAQATLHPLQAPPASTAPPFTHCTPPPSKQAGPARSKSTNHLPRAGPVILSTQRFKKLPQLFCQCFSRRVIVIQSNADVLQLFVAVSCQNCLDISHRVRISVYVVQTEVKECPKVRNHA